MALTDASSQPASQLSHSQQLDSYSSLQTPSTANVFVHGTSVTERVSE